VKPESPKRRDSRISIETETRAVPRDPIVGRDPNAEASTEAVREAAEVLDAEA